MFSSGYSGSTSGSFGSMDSNVSGLFSRSDSLQTSSSSPPPSISIADDSDSSAEHVSTPPLNTHHIKKPSPPPLPPSPAHSTNRVITTSSKPSSSMKRPKQENKEQHKEGIEPSTKKNKKSHPQEKATSTHKENECRGKNQGKKCAVPGPVSVPPSAHKSPKKPAQKWSPQEEVDFLSCLLAYSQEGKGFPKNMAPFYDTIKTLLNNDYSNSELSDKLKTLRAKFNGITDKVKDKCFSFKTAHEATLYKLSKKVWGSGEAEENDDSEDQKIEEEPTKLGKPNGRVEEKLVKEAEEEKKGKNVKMPHRGIEEEEEVEDGESNTEENLGLHVSNDMHSNQIRRVAVTNENEEEEEEGNESESSAQQKFPLSGSSGKPKRSHTEESGALNKSRRVAGTGHHKLTDHLHEQIMVIMNEFKDQLLKENRIWLTNLKKEMLKDNRDMMIELKNQLHKENQDMAKTLKRDIRKMVNDSFRS